MAKEISGKDNPVVEALRKLKDEEAELVNKLKPVQEAISALEKIVDKTVKKVKQSPPTKDSSSEVVEENLPESAEA